MPPAQLAPRRPSADELPFAKELYDSLAPVVNKLLWTLLGPDSERDDLAHEIFLRILQNAGNVRDRTKLQGWAASVAINAVKNEFRRRKLRRWVGLGAEDRSELAYHPDFEGREVLLRVYGVLAKLPPRERIPLTLQLVGQQSAAEIAAEAGASVRTVKRRLQAGRSRFLRLAGADPLLAERLRHSRFQEDEDV